MRFFTFFFFNVASRNFVTTLRFGFSIPQKNIEWKKSKLPQNFDGKNRNISINLNTRILIDSQI